MRSKKVVPVGQGCKRYTSDREIEQRVMQGRCKCHIDLYLNNCYGCGEKFHTDRPHTKTCSNKCRMRLSRMRHEKLFQTVMALT